jgi:hypothetical protein
VEKSKDPRSDWVFCRPDEKYKKECIHGVRKGPGIKLMVWSCIWERNKDPVIPIFEKRVDRWVYIGILEDGLLDAHQEVHDTIGTLYSSRIVLGYILSLIPWPGLRSTIYRS